MPEVVQGHCDCAQKETAAAHLAQIERAIIDAHARHDGLQLARLYGDAADCYEKLGDADAACFFLTQAMVFALQEGVDLAQTLRQRLHAYGREELE